MLPNKKIMESKEEFKEKFCAICGTQRCTSDGEWLDACPKYKEWINEQLT